MQAYSKPPSLWQLVEEIVPASEHAEIKEMLGFSLVEQSLELHQEILTLLEIWRQLRDERAEGVNSPRVLPEPPNQRDHLVKEICFFVESVKEKAKQKGVNPEQILKKHNSDILNYATELARPESSMSSMSRSSDGRETPMLPMAKERYEASELQNELKAVNKQLNYLDFDKVCENLRSTLIQEINQLIEDTQFLQGCLDNEADIRDCVTPGLKSREPTLTELREERSLLEKELLATGSLTATPVVNKPNFNTDSILLQTPTSSSDSSPQTTTDFYETYSYDDIFDESLTCTSKRGPLKATHKICVSSTSPVKLASAKLKAAKDREAQLKSNHLTSGNGRQACSSRSDGDLKPLRSKEQKLVVVDQNLSLKSVKQGGVLTEYRPKRRSVSTGRLRVVDVTHIVDAQSGKGDPVAAAAECLSFSSGPSSISSSPFNPSPPQYALDADTIIGPGSAHADRFRKMVLGCRDGK